MPHGLSSAEVDAAVVARLHAGESLYLLEDRLLAELKPDLLITQELCDVCAVSYDEVCRLSERLPGRPRVVSLQPPNLAGIFGDIHTIARAAGCPGRAEQLVGHLQARLSRVQAVVSSRPRPRVFALEWLDPPFAAGHWVPEMVALAGGEEVLGQAGKKSFRVTWQQIIESRPDVILLVPCGYADQAAQREFANLLKPAGWQFIPAVRTGSVHALDANSCFSRPGPRVVEGIESLAKLLHPVEAEDLAQVAHSSQLVP
jgi:iron complex transport system substrate-binding protein